MTSPFAKSKNKAPVTASLIQREPEVPVDSMEDESESDDGGNGAQPYRLE